jgi:hypothetical protein
MTTFKAKILIADEKIDRDNKKFAPNSVTCPEILPVFLNGNIIGSAQITKQRDQYYANMTLVESFPVQYLTPSVCGKIIKSKFMKNIQTIKECVIESIDLNSTGNVDPRIKTIKQQQEEPEIFFPNHYRKLPDGYKVIWLEDEERYSWTDGFVEGQLFTNKYTARNSAFKHHEENL